MGTSWSNQNYGHVNIYKNNSGRWVKIGGSIREKDLRKSGSSVALSSDGEIVAIGAPYNDSFNGQESGHVRVYSFASGSWIQLGEDINGPSDNSNFGTSLDISSDGSTIVVGIPGYGYRDYGAFEVYELDDTNTWKKIQQITHSTAQDIFQFGYDVSMTMMVQL